MDLLNTIKDLGLPAWLVVSASALVILRAIGLLDPLVSFFREMFGMVKERVEASSATERTEQIAIWSQVTKLQSQTLAQNELLLEYIINDVRQTLEEIRDEQVRQKYHTEVLEKKVSMLISIISEWYDKRNVTRANEKDNQRTEKDNLDTINL